jgi:hypothetical protein
MRRVLSYGLAPDTGRTGERTSRQHLHLRTTSHTELFPDTFCLWTTTAGPGARRPPTCVARHTSTAARHRTAFLLAALASSRGPLPAQKLERTRADTHHPSDFGMPSCSRSQLTSPRWSALQNRSRWNEVDLRRGGRTWQAASHRNKPVRRTFAGELLGATLAVGTCPVKMPYQTRQPHQNPVLKLL